MTPEERASKIESYGNAHALLVAALDEFPREMWQYRDERGGWSIHEIIVHNTDSEANSYIRCRRIIAEQGEPLMAYDENQWTATLGYHEQSTEDALALFKWLRHKSYTLIKTLPESVWAHASYHPENGDTTLEDWLDTYERHVPEHIEQMRENLEVWRAEQAAAVK
ncbi:MAG: hypothetical protein F4X57_07110 [Chloroflexi bacterium]|nr:hypothetical protein [Chloroflexota bacterium]